MKEIDAGHVFQLRKLDVPEPKEDGVCCPVSFLTFVKREGEKYPGNVGHHPGTTTQEVIRALIARTKYVDKQNPAIENQTVLAGLEAAILALEVRAARLHNRPADFSLAEVVSGDTACLKCGHIGCKGH